MYFFSIAIPTYEMHGFGAIFLEYSFDRLQKQTYKDFEILVSDHSKTDSIEKLCQKWKNTLSIKYIKNPYLVGNSSANLNNAINNSTGKWIKILFQDDFLYNKDSLLNIANYINTTSKLWYVTACEHSNDGINYYRPFFPKWNNNMGIGINTFSSPSVLTIKNTAKKYLFDESLIWLMDVDYYQRMYNSYGEPGYINDICVVNRTWSSSVTNTISEQTKSNEVTKQTSKQNNMTQVEKIFNKLCRLDYPQHFLYSRGIIDINEHLPLLRSYASECNHVTELGTRFAVSTLSFLIGKPKKVVSIDLNYHFYKPYEEEVNRFAKECEVDFKFIQADALKINIEETDLLFIDTLHTYEQLSKELRRHENKVRKWIILHDTITFGHTDEIFYSNGNISDVLTKETTIKKGLVPALNDFLTENKNWYIKETFTNNNGLTILQKNDSN